MNKNSEDFVTVYILQNKINKKIYIGQTNNFKRRMREHKAKDRVLTKNKHLYNSIKKYGFENFESIIVIENVNIENANKYETFLIEHFQTRNRQIGYNKAEGGTLNRGYHHTEKFKEEQSERLTKYYSNNTHVSAKLTIEQASEIRKIYLEGNSSTRDLAKLYKIDKSGITNIIYNKNYKDSNYIVDKLKIVEISKNLEIKNKFKAVAIKVRDEFCNEFLSKEEAALYYTVSSDTINRKLQKPNSKTRKNIPKFYLV